MITIEQLIKQTKPFKDERTRALVNMMYTSNLVFDYMNKTLADFDISYKQFNVLRIVKGAKENVSTSYIKQRLLVQNADTSRLVKRMIDKDLLQKATCENDARLISIKLSKKGNVILDKLSKVNIVESSPLSKLTKKDSKTLNEILNKIR